MEDLGVNICGERIPLHELLLIGVNTTPPSESAVGVAAPELALVCCCPIASSNMRPIISTLLLIIRSVSYRRIAAFSFCRVIPERQAPLSR
jgi:hypothetical protein